MTHKLRCDTIRVRIDYGDVRIVDYETKGLKGLKKAISEAEEKLF